MEVTLEQMLAAREARAYRQMTLCREYGLPQISFSMNIPGPVKDSPLIRRGFLAGCETLDKAIPQERVQYREIFPSETGWEAAWVVDTDAISLKAITTDIEDSHGLGRLFDMDVLDKELNKLDRELVAGRSRDCIVCGASGRGCASRRVHSVAQLQEAVRSILISHFRQQDARNIGNWAVQSLLEEVRTTPKPGLVDCRNQGSHRDMNLDTFIVSANALRSYFHRCAQLGQETAEEAPEATFARLREEGKKAEQTMFSATGGVNTHKGAIFTLGILCGAAGRLWRPEGDWQEETLFSQVCAMTSTAMEQDLLKNSLTTAGEKAFFYHGIAGIRGEVRDGLPSVAKTALPIYRSLKDRGRSYAGAVTLLHLIAKVQDTNMIKRGGLHGMEEARKKVRELLNSSPLPEIAGMEALDDWFISRNLSPGGCADLLAATYFMEHLLERS